MPEALPYIGPHPVEFVGRDDGDIVVRIDNVRITHMGEGVAAPQSRDVRIVERFTLDRGLGELSWGFTVTDPATFTEPVSAERYHVWRYRPGVQIEEYGCSVAG